MKYMGSKRYMLQNGLGDMILRRTKTSRRVVDLFCGTGVVAWFASQNTDRRVLAIDLQSYAVAAARAVICRDTRLDPVPLIKSWLDEAVIYLQTAQLWRSAREVEDSIEDTRELVLESRTLCEELSTIGPIWNAYGGYYFSPRQALTFDYLLKFLPLEEPQRSVCLAATIAAASRCAAAPGHTAQPFQPTPAAGKFLREFWNRDPLRISKEALCRLSELHAQVVGEASVGDAFDHVKRLQAGDLVIVDPPYSSVQYSRFYHVLETIARGQCNPVAGTGRYPPIEERPQSDFSKKSTSANALDELIQALSERGTTVILTFPAEDCSNGLSGNAVCEIARTYYDVEEKHVDMRFSTLGGNHSHRAPRKHSKELLLLLKPKRDH
jgi:adenine-specific DNA-methyltransferase